MKLLTFAVPCYNSQDYMEKCIDSLLPGGEDVEVLIIDDGSVDATAEIADRYEREHPGIVRAIHQENAGHGGAVNTGIREATGLCFKVVDSDDWIDANAYGKVLELLKNLSGGDKVLDMLITNYVYDREGTSHKKVMHYTSLPQNRMFSWNEAKMHNAQYILMHSVTYRTKLLRECRLQLPEHMFYVDNIYVYNPIPHVRNMYYLDENFYHYYIGREDQSVNEEVMIQRIDQQIAVNKLMIDKFDLKKMQNRMMRHYMFHYLEIVTIVTTVMLIRSGTLENLQKKRELWKYIKDKDIVLFHALRRGILGQTMNLPGKGGRKVSVILYKIAQKSFGFN